VRIAMERGACGGGAGPCQPQAPAPAKAKQQRPMPDLRGRIEREQVAIMRSWLQECGVQFRDDSAGIKRAWKSKRRGMLREREHAARDTAGRHGPLPSSVARMARKCPHENTIFALATLMGVLNMFHRSAGNISPMLARLMGGDISPLALQRFHRQHKRYPRLESVWRYLGATMVLA